MLIFVYESEVLQFENFPLSFVVSASPYGQFYFFWWWKLFFPRKHPPCLLSINQFLSFTQIHTFATNIPLPCLTDPFIPTSSPSKWLSSHIDNSFTGDRNANPGRDDAALGAAGDDYRTRRGAGAERDQGDGGVQWDFAVQASKHACRSGRLHPFWFL